MIKKCIFFSKMDFSFCLNTLNRSVQQPPYCLWILLAENFVTLQKNSLLLNFKEKREIQDYSIFKGIERKKSRSKKVYSISDTNKLKC